MLIKKNVQCLKTGIFKVKSVLLQLILFKMKKNNLVEL